MEPEINDIKKKKGEKYKKQMISGIGNPYDPTGDWSRYHPRLTLLMTEALPIAKSVLSK